MSKIENAHGKNDVHTMDPDDLTIVDETGSALMDARINLAQPESWVRLLDTHGVLTPIQVRRNGDLLEVVDGRQRVRGLREANRRRREDPTWPTYGQPPQYVSVGIVTTRKVGKDQNKGFKLRMLVANRRLEDTPLSRAQNIRYALDQGVTMDEIAESLDLTKATVKASLDLLDLAPKVQEYLEAGRLAETAARPFVGITRAEQEKLLEEMEASGQLLTGHAVSRAVEAKKTGKKYDRKEIGLRPRSPKIVAKMRDAIGTIPNMPSSQRQQIVAVLDWALGRDIDTTEYPVLGEALMAAIVEVEATKGKKGKGKKVPRKPDPEEPEPKHEPQGRAYDAEEVDPADLPPEINAGDLMTAPRRVPKADRKAKIAAVAKKKGKRP